MNDSAVKQAEILARYLTGPEKLAQVVSGLAETQLDTAPRPGSWTVRQIVHHLADGDDLWKGFIKQAIGNPGGEFSLAWYWSMPQDEWAARWQYAARDIEPSLALFRSIREHIGQLLETNPHAWHNKLTVQLPQGKSETVTIGEIVEMQAHHVEHHLSAIRDILRTSET